MNEKPKETNRESNFFGVSPCEKTRKEVEQEASWWECLFDGWEHAAKGEDIERTRGCHCFLGSCMSSPPLASDPGH